MLLKCNEYLHGGNRFLLVKLLLQLLGAKKPKSPNAMRLLLNDIAQGAQGLQALDNTYTQMWEVINKERTRKCKLQETFLRGCLTESDH